MMGGLGGPGRMLNTEVQKPKNVLATIARFWTYFYPYWPAIVLTLITITARCSVAGHRTGIDRDRQLIVISSHGPMPVGIPLLTRQPQMLTD
jgi:hypothetical protein